MTARRTTVIAKPITIVIDGKPLACAEGETIAAAVLAGGLAAVRRDSHGQPRGLFCNMGTCGECTVTLLGDGRRVRACLTNVVDGLEIATLG